MAAKVKQTRTRKSAPANRKKKVAKKSAAVKKITPPGAVGSGTAEPAMMKTLRAEHRHMGTVLKLFADQLEAIEAGEVVYTHVVYEIMDYMTAWPDRFHHPREDLVYARVAELNASAADEVDTLQRDHDHTAKRGKKLLQDIERWRAGEIDAEVVVKKGRGYIEHVYEHMNIEENIVFPHIEAQLTLDDWRELEAEDTIQAVAEPVFGPLIQREYRSLSRKLRRNLRRSVESGVMAEWIGIDAFMESLEVMSIGYESARDTTSTHVRAALQESMKLIRESPVSAPLLCAANNTRMTFRLLGEYTEISRETANDLSRVNRERKDRIRLLQRGGRRR